MGFDIYIRCSLDICKDTGRYFYYKGLEKIYDMPKIVPEEHRGFVNMKGRIFRIYTDLVTDDMSTSVENFIDKYPSWSDILEDSDFKKYSDFWNEDMHNRFYSALKWFSEEGSCYMISWSN
jgi:hypothetical protein